MIEDNLNKLFFECCNHKKNEKICILYDDSTKKLIKYFCKFLEKKKYRI